MAHSLTAEYPLDLARHLLTHLALRVTKIAESQAFAIPLKNTDPPTTAMPTGALRKANNL